MVVNVFQLSMMLAVTKLAAEGPVQCIAFISVFYFSMYVFHWNSLLTKKITFGYIDITETQVNVI
jgi:hypothetical protein